MPSLLLLHQPEPAWGQMNQHVEPLVMGVRSCNLPELDTDLQQQPGGTVWLGFHIPAITLSDYSVLVPAIVECTLHGGVAVVTQRETCVHCQQQYCKNVVSGALVLPWANAGLCSKRTSYVQCYSLACSAPSPMQLSKLTHGCAFAAESARL